jgi:hypothetical protein
MGSVARTCLALMLPVSGCTTSLPGEEVGTYRVQMTLRENTCGAQAVHVQEGHSYKVQLRRDETGGYWRIMGQQPLSGEYEAGQFAFTFSSAVAQSAPDASSFCQLLQSERLSGRVSLVGLGDAGVDAGGATTSTDAGALPEGGLSGDHVFAISAAPGTDCSEALAPRGPFQQLPCTVRYALSGAETEPF